MALTVESVINGVMANPDVAIIGVAAGFLISKAMNMRRRRSGFGGGF